MPAAKKQQLNKSELMRNALSQNSKKTPSEIARMLTEQHGVPFRPNAVSTIKAELRKKQGKTRPHPRRVVAKQASPATQVSRSAPSRVDGIAQLVSNLQTYIKRIGKDDLKGLIDTL